ncbi:MAG: dihydropteroate synthase [Chloroflexi bacterium]|nr:dihydropteroate synthase [Chloroflexota bacterium]
MSTTRAPLFLIGQRITVGTASVRRALLARQRAPIQELARRQAAAGVHALDLNVGFLAERAAQDGLPWLVRVVQDAVALPLSLDSVHATAIAAALSVCRGEALINSCTAEPSKLEALVPLAAARRCRTIVLPLDNKGVPATARERASLVKERVLPAADHYGVPRESLLVDVLVPALAAGPEAVTQTLATARLVGEELGLPTLAGLGNIAYRAPPAMQGHLQMALLAMLAGAGLAAAILDPLDPELMGVARALASGQARSPLEALCLKLEAAYRQGRAEEPPVRLEGAGVLGPALAALRGD